MIEIPEILDHIATYLDADSFFACVSVCRQWKDLFTPHLWREVDPSNRKEYIRNLTVVDNGQLLASLDSDLTGLHSLTLKRVGGSYWLKETEFFDDGTSNNMDGNVMFSQACKTRPWDDLIPIYTFTGTDLGEATQGRASWLLVLNNPDLRQLIIDRSWGSYSFKTTWVFGFAGTNRAICKRSATVLSETLSKMTLLQHIEIGLCADDYLLTNLVTILPNLTSFVHSGDAEFDPQVIMSQLPHQALKQLVFKKAITVKQLRAIATVFPVLVHLSAERFGSHHLRSRNNLDSDGNLVPSMEVLEWKTLESLKVTGTTFDANGVLDAHIRLPRVVRLDKGAHNIYNPAKLQHVLSTFPALLRLECSSKYVGEVTFINKVFTQTHPVQELLLRKVGFAARNVKFMFLQMPFLVHLEMDCFEFEGETVLELVRTYKKLERLRFDLQDDSSRAMVDILNECPATLKSCRGQGHVVLAEDVVNFADWSSCTGLEELDIEIVGVAGLNKKQQALLSYLWKLDRAWFEEHMNPKTTLPEDEEIEAAAVEAAVEQARARALKLGHTLTPNEAEALHHRQSLYCLQRATYKRLGRLTQLRELNFYPGEYWEFAEYAWVGRSFTLDHTLLAGLAGLADLVHLEVIRFMGPAPRSGEADLAWMLRHWSMEVVIVSDQIHFVKAKSPCC
ncbi:hypothetical protein EC991_009418 [Linnemannia zychae]|nr:hypothetical protein EC991_009418 [Linnemannia zychae]